MSKNRLANLYLDLLEDILLDNVYNSDVAIEQPWNPARAGKRATENEVKNGNYWPARAHTMIGRKRLQNFRKCIEAAIEDKVSGDILEAGVWRGGASIYARGVLQAYNDEIRKVYVADSFRGLPRPSGIRYPQDKDDEHWRIDYLRVPLEEVKSNFAAYGLLDDQVIFLPGLFEETLHNAPVNSLAVLRLDGDMYSSTIQALEALHHKVSPGGFVIIDDYFALPSCRSAVDDFREKRKLKAQLETIDWTGVFWRVEK